MKVSMALKSTTILGLIVALLGGEALAAPAQGAPRNIPGPAGYSKVLFADDFSTYKAGAQPWEGKWTIDTGTSYPGGPANWGTGEVQTYTKSTTNIVITSTGTLKIIPSKAFNGQWSSARLETTKNWDFSCAAGKKIRMEANLKVNNAAASKQMGIWPAFWSLGSKYRGNYWNWPAVSELDIMEQLNGIASAWQTLHCGAGSSTGGPCNEPNGIGGKTGFTRGVFHTVSLEIDRTNKGGDWKGEKLVWYVDGKATQTITGAQVNNQVAWTAVARDPHFLLLNVAVGGGFPDGVAGSKTPTSATAGGSDSAMEVKYVAVFST